MTKPDETPKKTKKQLKRSATYSLLIALMIAYFPTHYILDYKKQGFIYTGKARIVTASGEEAFLIIYGTAAAAAFAALIAIYNAVKNIIKIRKGEFSEEDESPEFVICSRCKTPQYSKDLVDGHCAKCRGDVENLEGYYDRHRKKKTGQ
jgi:hypothetical protein